MKILVNYIAASHGGALTVLKQFYERVRNDEECNKHEWTFLLSGRFIDDTKNITTIIRSDIKKNWARRFLFDSLTGRLFIKKMKFDLVISLQNTCIMGLKCRQILFVHQSIPFQNTKKFSFLRKNEFILATYQYLIGYQIKRSIKLSDVVVVQTEWMKKAIAKKVKKPIDQIRVIKTMVNSSSHQENQLNHDCVAFFYPAFESVYKNQEVIDNACDILLKRDIRTFEIYLTIEGKSPNDKINKIGRIDEIGMRNMYKKSVLLFPSYIETVGLPLMEAMSYNMIILVADCEYSRETVMNYKNAFFFNPFDSNELALLMEKIIKGDYTLEFNHTTYDNVDKFDNWKKVVFNDQ